MRVIYIRGKNIQSKQDLMDALCKFDLSAMTSSDDSVRNKAKADYFELRVAAKRLNLEELLKNFTNWDRSI